MKLKDILLFAISIFIFSCSHQNKKRGLSSPGVINPDSTVYGPIEGPSLQIEKDVTVNIPALFLSDSQLNNYLTAPSMWRTAFADFVPVAIRPPRLDLFADDLLKWSLEVYGKNKYLIYLGDALNMGCETEWDRFKRIILPKNRKHIKHRGFVTAPGNHDFYFYGNTSGSRLSLRRNLIKTWSASCNSEVYPHVVPRFPLSTIMTKDKFIIHYIRLLRKQRELFPEDFPFDDEPIVRSKKYCKNTKVVENRIGKNPMTLLESCDWRTTTESFLRKIHWVLPRNSNPKIYEAFWSLLVQEVQIPVNDSLTLRIFLLDTQDYKKYPGLFGGGPKNIFKKFNPGLTGEVQERQFRKVLKWIQDDKKEGYLNFFAGHHPKNSLTDRTKTYIRQLINHAGNGVYVSSHTHTGWVDKTEKIEEVNIGSTTDWPPHVVEFGVKQDQQQTIVNPKVSYLHPVDVSPTWSCKSSFDNTTGKDPYLSYKAVWGTQDKIHEITFDLMLKAYYKMFKRLKVFEKYNDGGEVNILLDRLAKEVEIPWDCKKIGRESGKDNRLKCLTFKSILIRDVLAADRKWLFQNDEDRWKRIQYGACQAGWASKMEFVINGFWKGPFHTLGVE